MKISDLISRQDAIDALTSRVVALKGVYGDLGGAVSGARKLIESLPSAEPERKKGEWLDRSWSEHDPNVCCSSYELQSAKCSVCGKYHTTPYLYKFDNYEYCPNCGSYNGGKNE